MNAVVPARPIRIRHLVPGVAFLAATSLLLASCQSAPEQQGTSTGQQSSTPSAGKIAASTGPTPTAVQADSHLSPNLPDYARNSVMINLLMREYAYLPKTLYLPAGKNVTLVLYNRGTVPHEFMAGRDVTGDRDGFKEDLFEGVEVLMEGGMPEDAEHHEEGHSESKAHDQESSGTEHHEGEDHNGTRILVAPGEAATMNFTLPLDRKGEWEMGCFQPDHYESGMHGTVRVE